MKKAAREKIIDFQLFIGSDLIDGLFFHFSVITFYKLDGCLIVMKSLEGRTCKGRT
jgi:hypothetical protein